MKHLVPVLILDCAFAALGFITSLVVHSFIHKSDRTWFTKHRIAPGIGIMELFICFMFRRAQLRDVIVEQALAPVIGPSVLDATAYLSTLASYGSGVMAADIWREYVSE